MTEQGKPESVSLFRNDREAAFIRRPNRFLIIAGDNGEEIPCHCPNPGRLIEFLIPGTRYILERRKSGTGKTDWTAAGLYYRDSIVPLFSARANLAAEQLILEKIIPDLCDIKPEYSIGNSRFDFFCSDKAGNRHLVEVKACSLVEYGTAMFPDAPSGRALKHLEELASLTGESYICHVLFVIVHGNPELFRPNLHTDPLFARALSHFSDKIRFHAALLSLDAMGNAKLVNSRIPLDLGHGELAGENRGSYLILLELPGEMDIEVGALGTMTFPPGWYIYAGSAMKNISQRLARHLKKHKTKKHWHIDYLTAYARTLKGFPILSYRNLECGLAGELEKICTSMIADFGSSDCGCKSHLAYFRKNPLQDPAFVDMLMRFRHREAFRH